MPELVYTGLGLSLLGFLAGGMIVNYYRNDVAMTPPTRSASIAMTVAAINAFASFIAYCGITED